MRRIRLAADLSQEQVAERMGVDRSYVSSLELGGRNPTIVTLWHAATALGVKVAELLSQNGEEHIEAAKPRRRASKRPL